MGMAKLPKTHSYRRRGEKVATVSVGFIVSGVTYRNEQSQQTLVRIDLVTVEILPSDQD